MKFTSPGGTVRILTKSNDDGGLKITVYDTGMGIAEKDIPLVLEPFGQVDNAMTRKFESAGLGLSLAKALIRQHGGDLSIVSELGVGTTVSVTFPAERVL